MCAWTQTKCTNLSTVFCLTCMEVEGGEAFWKNFDHEVLGPREQLGGSTQDAWSVFLHSERALKPKLSVQIYLPFFAQPAWRQTEAKRFKKKFDREALGPEAWGATWWAHRDAWLVFSNSVQTHAGGTHGKNMLLIHHFDHHFDPHLGPIAITKTPHPIIIRRIGYRPLHISVNMVKKKSRLQVF